MSRPRHNSTEDILERACEKIDELEKRVAALEARKSLRYGPVYGRDWDDDN